MTLMNTISNIGTKWPQTFFLWLVDIISWKRCLIDESTKIYFNSTILHLNKCENKAAKEICIKGGGYCHTDIDGFYIEGAINVIYGLIFYAFSRKLIDYLERLPLSDWHVLSTNFNKNPEGIELNSELRKI